MGRLEGVVLIIFITESLRKNNKQQLAERERTTKITTM